MVTPTSDEQPALPIKEQDEILFANEVCDYTDNRD